MGRCRDKYEPMCETSEASEKLFSRESLLHVSLEIGGRILELFGYQKLSTIVFRLRIHKRELSAVINGEQMPSAEMLLGIRQITGASIDWILTGEGDKFLPVEKLMVRPPQTLSLPPRPPQDPREQLYVEIPSVS